MKIKQIYIENFRSIKELKFKPENLNALVWPNSVWKTNILKAIDLVLWEWRTTKWKVIKELFNDTSKPIVIKIFFESPIVWHYHDQPKNIQAISLIMKYQTGNLDAQTRLREYHWGELTWWRINEWEHEWYYMNDQRKKLCCYIYIPASRNLHQEMRVSQRSMLGKMMKTIQENYIEHYADEGWEDTLKIEFEWLMLWAKNFLEADFDTSDSVLTFKKFVTEFKSACTQNSLWLANSFSTKLNIYNLNRFYKTLQIHLKEDFCDKDFDATEVWSWMQNLLLLSIFQTYAKLMSWKVIFWIEEPEIYLYPQAQRWLFETFKELSNTTQIFYTTHNPNFVDAYRAPEIWMLWKNENWTYLYNKNTSILNWETADREQFRIYTHFNPERNELFFAKKILLVEWKSDKILFSNLAKKRQVDINKEWIAIIECWGKWWVIYFLWICKLLWLVDYYWIWDSDEVLSDNYNILSWALTESKWLEIPWNLEVFLTSETWLVFSWNSSNKVKQAYDWSNNVDVTNIPVFFESIKTFFSPTKVETNALENDS